MTRRTVILASWVGASLWCAAGGGADVARLWLPSSPSYLRDQWPLFLVPVAVSILALAVGLWLVRRSRDASCERPVSSSWDVVRLVFGTVAIVRAVVLLAGHPLREVMVRGDPSLGELFAAISGVVHDLGALVRFALTTAFGVVLLADPARIWRWLLRTFVGTPARHPRETPDPSTP